MEKKKPKLCTIEAPCKINLHLWVGEKRNDGFHTLEGLFVALAFGDTLRFECTGNKEELALSMNWDSSGEPASGDPGGEYVLGECIPAKKNLVFRAVSLFREQTGYKNGLRICLDKRIPLGSGLGGGSSDAASTLLALNSLAGNPLSIEELSKMALVLGSDVPFFLTGGAAFVSGRGEVVEPVAFPGKLWVVLVKPPFSSNTSSAYRLLDKAREKRGINELDLNAFNKEDLIRALERDPSAWPFQNDFLTVFGNSACAKEMEEPDQRSAAAYRAITEALRKAGASFAGLSGSGSCCFGIFGTRDAAEKAEKILASEFCRMFPSEQTNFLKLTFFLAYKAIPVLEY